jgi:hypothetical protein
MEKNTELRYERTYFWSVDFQQICQEYKRNRVSSVSDIGKAEYLLAEE